MASGIGERISEAFHGVADEQLRRISERLDPMVSNLRARYQKLEPREKVLVLVAGSLLSVFLVYNLVYGPIQSWQASLDSRIAARQRELADVRHLSRVYSELKLDLATAEKRTVSTGKDFSLFSVVETSLTKSVGRNKIGSITPSDKKISDELIDYEVNVKLSDVSLAQLVDALYDVKAMSVPIVVSNLNVKKRTQDSHSYDVELTCSAVGRNG
ncbi:MAG TPA: type II secretion system protein GspM [Candidatus Binataceae bacterium]|nr:type II secretion system protein GspM [Candidatus Binataceae bacterium]